MLGLIGLSRTLALFFPFLVCVTWLFCPVLGPYLYLVLNLVKTHAPRHGPCAICPLGGAPYGRLGARWRSQPCHFIPLLLQRAIQKFYGTALNGAQLHPHVHLLFCN